MRRGHDGDDRCDARRRGVTLLELAITTVVLSTFLGGVVVAVVEAQNAFLQSQVFASLNVRGQNALNRIVSLASQAVTSDAQFSPLRPTTGIDSHCLRFRIIQSVDALTGQPIYDDVLRVYLYGPDDGANPSRGLIVGRGPDLDRVYAVASGRDGFLGTADDDSTTPIAGDIPASELLVPETFAPRAGDMFTVNVTPAPIGRLITFTLRLNVTDLDGDFLLPDDLVFVGQVALRQ